MKKFYFILFTSLYCQDSNFSVAENILKTLSLEQKIAQLFIIGISNTQYLLTPVIATNSLFSNEKEEKFTKDLAERLIIEYGVGGVHFVRYGTIESSMRAIKELQSLSKLPLLISQDFEWGLNMRLVDAIKFPYNLTLGAIKDNKLIYDLGKEIGRQCKLLGVHINFAPVADINSNPKNPIINVRSFGSDKYNVAEKCIQFMRGLQDAGIIACAKHFCGHGDTSVDSHIDLPVIAHDLARLHDLELYPFKQLIKAGIKAIMTAHMHVPAIDNRTNIPITLSSNAINNLLRKQLHFSGLVITDALDMQAISKYFNPGEVEIEAFVAGNDILLMSENVPAAISNFKKAIDLGRISLDDLDMRVLKILKTKEEFGLFNINSSFQDNLAVSDFNTESALNLKKKLDESSYIKL